MKTFNIHEAKAHLSALIDRAAEGETLVICRRNVPMAELRPLPRARSRKRPIGLARGTFELSNAFFEPLPESGVEGFEGR